jgi:hypothetical protein
MPVTGFSFLKFTVGARRNIGLLVPMFNNMTNLVHGSADRVSGIIVLSTDEVPGKIISSSTFYSKPTSSFFRVTGNEKLQIL